MRAYEGCSTEAFHAAFGLSDSVAGGPYSPTYEVYYRPGGQIHVFWNRDRIAAVTVTAFGSD